MREQCLALGVDPAQWRASRDTGAAPPEAFELWPEHLEAFEVFHACKRQWRLAVGFEGIWFQGLDFAAVDVAMRRLGVEPETEREVFLQLQVMEDEGAKLLNA